MDSVKPIIEVLSPFSMHEPIHRMKITGLISQLGQVVVFDNFGSGEKNPDGVLINCLHQDIIDNPEFLAALRGRATDALVMMMMADFYPNSIEYLSKWSKFVDVFLVPTPEMRDFIQIYTHSKVEVLIDPIDFGLITSEKVRSEKNSRLRVVWFGYPESYSKSMVPFEETLIGMHRSGDIEFHIISKNESYGEGPNGFMHEYNPDTFLELLSNFDVCVLSHLPFDFSISTQWKSENKAVLAINRGLPVLASKTPAYSRLLENCNVESSLFSTNLELKSAITRMQDADARKVYLNSSQDFVLQNYSVDNLAKQFLDLFHVHRNLKSLQDVG
jgi:glycosyltransferase involved in cell wall biosynthesis